VLIVGEIAAALLVLVAGALVPRVRQGDDVLDVDRLGGLGAADERDRLTGGRVDQDTALGVARARPHDQLAGTSDARREAASAAIRPRRQPGQASAITGMTAERRVGMIEPT
jgi:hypothetical protein